jgi:hypothetical protein
VYGDIKVEVLINIFIPKLDQKESPDPGIDTPTPPNHPHKNTHEIPHSIPLMCCSHPRPSQGGTIAILKPMAGTTGELPKLRREVALRLEENGEEGWTMATVVGLGDDEEGEESDDDDDDDDDERRRSGAHFIIQ